jgi:hypothetical protein
VDDCPLPVDPSHPRRLGLRGSSRVAETWDFGNARLLPLIYMARIGGRWLSFVGNGQRPRSCSAW